MISSTFLDQTVQTRKDKDAQPVYVYYILTNHKNTKDPGYEAANIVIF